MKTKQYADEAIDRLVRHGKRNLEWAERELMKMQDVETEPQLRALWSTAARIARAAARNTKTYPEYSMGGGTTIKPRLELDGIVKAGPDWDCEPCEVKVFDVFQNGKLRARGVETWQEAKEIAFTLRINPAA